jgi:hypothetical protein
LMSLLEACEIWCAESNVGPNLRDETVARNRGLCFEYKNEWTLRIEKVPREIVTLQNLSFGWAGPFPEKG